MTAFLIILSLLTFLNYAGFLFVIWKGLKKLEGEEKPLQEKSIPVTVVVPFRNEIENLSRVVESLLNQEYERDLLEIIFVNDHSTDGSLEFLENHSQRNRFEILTVGEESTGRALKKEAITKAIEEAKGEVIFITDADCSHSPVWIKEMLKTFQGSVGFVAAPVIFESGKGCFAELQKIEFAGIQVAAAGLIGTGRPATCSAANIAFLKKAFLEVNGYEGNKELSSGDDEFLMQKIHRHSDYEVKFLTGEEIVVKTKANSTLKSFLNQRRRWASKSLLYENKLLIAELFAIFLFFLAIPVNLILGFFLSDKLLMLGLILFFLKMAIEYFVLKKGLPLLYPKEEFKCFLVAELLHIPYILTASVLGVFGNFEWKGRKLER